MHLILSLKFLENAICLAIIADEHMSFNGKTREFYKSSEDTHYWVGQFAVERNYISGQMDCPIAILGYLLGILDHLLRNVAGCYFIVRNKEFSSIEAVLFE